MLKLSKMADYAVVVLTPLARNETGLMTASSLSEATGLPEPTVAKILKLLARAEILQSERGASGGYRLARSPEAINVASIISAVDGPISLTACVDGSAETCGMESRCAVKGRWNGVNRVIREALEGITLADMVSNHFFSRDSGNLKVPAFAGTETEGGA